MHQSNQSLNIPLGNPPGYLNFWKIFVPIPLSPGQKAVHMPPPLGKLPDYCFNFSVASVTLQRLCMLTWFIRQCIFIYYKYKSLLYTFKYGTHLVKPLFFNQSATNSQIFSFEFMKVCLRCLRHDLSAHMESARLVT